MSPSSSHPLSTPSDTIIPFPSVATAVAQQNEPTAIGVTPQDAPGKTQESVDQNLREHGERVLVEDDAPQEFHPNELAAFFERKRNMEQRLMPEFEHHVERQLVRLAELRIQEEFGAKHPLTRSEKFTQEVVRRLKPQVYTCANQPYLFVVVNNKAKQPVL